MSAPSVEQVRIMDRERLIALADDFELGTAKAVASGYQEFGPVWQHDRELIVKALRAYSGDHAPQALSQWTDRDMLIGGTRYKAGSITIADVLDHAARASNEFYADDDELSEEDRHMVDWAWEKHKSAAPKFLATEDGEFNGNVVPERETVTIFVPDGYSSAAEFVKDCGFEPATTPPQSAASTVEPVADPGTIVAPYNPCLAKLRVGEPFFVLLGRDKQAPEAVTCWANARERAEGKTAWTEQAREVAAEMATYSGAAPTTSPEPDAVREMDKHADIIDRVKFLINKFPDSGPAVIEMTTLVGRLIKERDAALSRPAHGGWPTVPPEITDDMRYAAWKAQGLHVGATELEAIQMANRHMTPEQRAMDQAAYAAMLGAIPRHDRNTPENK